MNEHEKQIIEKYYPVLDIGFMCNNFNLVRKEVKKYVRNNKIRKHKHKLCHKCLKYDAIDNSHICMGCYKQLVMQSKYTGESIIGIIKQIIGGTHGKV